MSDTQPSIRYPEAEAATELLDVDDVTDLDDSLRMFVCLVREQGKALDWYQHIKPVLHALAGWGRRPARFASWQEAHSR